LKKVGLAPAFLFAYFFSRVPAELLPAAAITPALQLPAQQTVDGL
jgi:hypothetical protein